MLCAKCNTNEATVHVQGVFNGTEQEPILLCLNCAQTIGLSPETLQPKEIEPLSVVGKNCQFCGSSACSGLMPSTDGAIYFCPDCGLEFGGILRNMLIDGHPDLLERTQRQGFLLDFCSDPELQSWSEAASRKALRTLKERRRQDGREKGS